MEKSNIIRAVMEKAYQISPEAVELILSSDSPEDLLKYVLSTVNNSVIVIGIEDIDLEGFVVSGKVSKPIYAGNEKKPGPETSSGEPPSDKLQVSYPEESKFLSGTSIPSPGSCNLSPEPELSLKADPSFNPDSFLEPAFPSEPIAPSEPDTVIATPDPVIKSSQVPVSDAISVPDIAPDINQDTAYEPAPDIEPDTFSSEKAPDSYFASNSTFSVKAVPPTFPSHSSQNINRSASSFFGQGSSLPSPSSNRMFRAEPTSSVSGNGLFSVSRDEYKHYPGKNPVTVISDITGHSTCVGEYTQFVQYFRDRYSRLSEIIRGRINARPIESLKRRSFRRGGDGSSEEISIIGMVSDFSSTTNGHKILSLEDPTGSFSVLIRNADKELFELASRILLDEVIGVTGSVTNDGNLMIATKLIQPDAPNNVQRRTGNHGKAVLISDVHVGSSQFLEDAWLDFLDFLKGESDSEDMRELAASIRYLVVAGDLVDGIGIYPDQETELNILNVYEQYRKAAEYFREIPEHIRVIISPGNHDAVRQAEPQPALPDNIQADFPQNVVFVGNPALVELDGIRVLIYHGRSIDDLVASIPGVSYQEPAGAVLEMLKRRHLAPTYGSRVSISPEKKDYFVIDPVPDIIHTGHVHTLGVQRYKNVLLVNSGTWQDQTEFQKRVNLIPVPARVPIVDLEDLDVKILAFD
ncbi:DNA-directed DNA polymerase II small subunit [Methanosarcina sp. MSH10X1]|uniref:DNA-directed DNA polymerase II small subunit n=1 Tax=Methanosarcina sp. MSH10X1 TaxID=2507075 RepID=UPI000FFB5EDC|nr:DNA-directed DNA polymerase II small subunit [Methanosarcina sp. MSH10X1]RXA18753.1 DNA-directed DNA polymerase II small subunit [Methanosarcina sp. MSH10X1]